MSQPNPVPYGTILTASAVPDLGKYFLTWSDGAATGTNAPTTITVTNANPAINALFTTLPVGEYSLGVVVIGNGSVTTTPQQNYFNPGECVTLNAAANANNHFYGWSQDASGTNNSIAILMSGNEIVRAYFIALVITSPPTNQTVIAGNTATFNVTVESPAPLSYQWQFGATNIVGATDATLSLSNIFPNMAGTYTVTISNVYGSVTSSPALLTAKPIGITSPAIRAAGHFQFSFQSAPGVNYGVQYSTNLIEWLSLVTLNGNGTLLTYIDTNTPASQQRFYRIVLSSQ